MHCAVLVDVLLLEMPLVEYGAKRTGLKDRKDCRLAAVVLLKSALEELDHHYHGKRKSRMVRAGADDYRPTQVLVGEDAY